MHSAWSTEIKMTEAWQQPEKYSSSSSLFLRALMLRTTQRKHNFFSGAGKHLSMHTQRAKFLKHASHIQTCPSPLFRWRHFLKEDKISHSSPKNKPTDKTNGQYHLFWITLYLYFLQSVCWFTCHQNRDDKKGVICSGLLTTREKIQPWALKKHKQGSDAAGSLTGGESR